MPFRVHIAPLDATVDAGTLLGWMRDLGRPGEGDVEAFLGRDDTAVLVARVDGAPCGVAALIRLPRLGHATPEARLLDLYVDEHARRRGVAEALVEESRAWAVAAGCHVLRLECGHAREAAHRLYARLGFEHRGRDYQLALGGAERAPAPGPAPHRAP